MTEEHFNNGKTLLENRNRIAKARTVLQTEDNISILKPLKNTDASVYVQIRDFARQKLEEEEARLQAAFDALKESELTPEEKEKDARK